MIKHRKLCRYAIFLFEFSILFRIKNGTLGINALGKIFTKLVLFANGLESFLHFFKVSKYLYKIVTPIFMIIMESSNNKSF
jgi:hypothetical protein